MQDRSDTVCRVLVAARPPKVRTRYLLAALAIAAAGFALRYDALPMGFAADDYAQLGMLNGDYLVYRSPLNLFNFSDGTTAEITRLMHGGFFPWWTYPHVRLSLFRPLASAMTWLDWKLFGSDPLPYHVHSLIWWLALLALVARVFYRLLSVRVALVAFAFFAADEAHGLPLAWIANRNAIVSAVFSLIALLAFLRHRQSGRARELWLVCVSFAVALFVGEYAVCAIGYFVAYALLVERGPLATRLRGLWPVFVPVVVCLGLRAALGLTPRDSGVYLDPFADTWLFARELPKRLPALYADLMFGVRADWWTFGIPGTFELVQLKKLPESWLWSQEPWRRIHIAIGYAAIVALVCVFRLTPRDERTRNVHWLCAGAVLSTLPVAASFPSSRLLLIGLVGFTPMLAAAVCTAFLHVRERWQAARWRTAGAVLAGVLLAGYHTGGAGWQTHAEVSGLRYGSAAIRKAVLDMEVDERKLPKQRVVVLNALDGASSQYIPLVRALAGKVVPEVCWTLSLTIAPHVITRDAPNSFIFAPTSGYVMQGSGDILRTHAKPMRLGEIVDVGGMRVRVLSLLNGQPKAIRVTFDRPLEDPSLLFILPTRDGIRPYTLPPVGGTAITPLPGLPY